jgi:hypothetical protein
LTLRRARRCNGPVTPLDRQRWTTFLAVAERVVPQVASFDEGGRERFAAIVGKALADRPRSLRRQFALFLTVLRWAPLLRFGAPFERLAPAAQDAVLRWLMEAPAAKLRGGFWGLRALVFMGTYGQPETWGAIGYAPSFSGNERLHG